MSSLDTAPFLGLSLNPLTTYVRGRAMLGVPKSRNDAQILIYSALLVRFPARGVGLPARSTAQPRNLWTLFIVLVPNSQSSEVDERPLTACSHFSVYLFVLFFGAVASNTIGGRPALRAPCSGCAGSVQLNPQPSSGRARFRLAPRDEVYIGSPDGIDTASLPRFQLRAVCEVFAPRRRVNLPR